VLARGGAEVELLVGLGSEAFGVVAGTVAGAGSEAVGVETGWLVGVGSAANFFSFLSGPAAVA
jgi:hypothetical protein